MGKIGPTGLVESALAPKTFAKSQVVFKKQRIWSTIHERFRDFCVFACLLGLSLVRKLQARL